MTRASKERQEQIQTAQESQLVQSSAEGGPEADIAVPSSDTERVAVGDAPPIALITERVRPDGPVTTKRLRRTIARYGVLAAAGTVLAHAAGDRGLANVGTGLVAPGAGYLSAGRPGRFVATLPAFVASLGLWLGSGNVLAPLTVWGGTALASARHGVRRPGARRVVPVAAAALLAGTWAARERGFRKAVKRREERNSYLRELGATQASSTTVAPRGAAGRAPAVSELSSEQLALSRFALERALQPVPEFEGYDKIDQFQTSSIRYQVAMSGYALAALQYAYTPAFHGYLSLAQRNLISKWQERVCWGFWSKESVWGHLRYNPDPIPRDDIMVSGWLGYQIAGYVSNTGDQRYSEPGSITFAHPRGQRYEYDFNSMTAALAANFEKSPFTLFPCEPNWIYALCNGFGILPLPIHDRLYGTDYAKRVVPNFRRDFENEFLSVDGRTIGLRSKWTGLTVPAMTSIISDASVIWQIVSIMPDVARRQYEIMRREWAKMTSDGTVDVKLSGWDFIDTGNYRPSAVSALLWLQLAAAELGDMEMARAAGATIERDYRPVIEGGVKRYGGASVQSNLLSLASMTAQPNSHHDRINKGLPKAWAEGPVLEESAFPDVLVARAVSDGQALDLVLRPGAGAGRKELGIKRLRPGARYSVTGAAETEVAADQEGRASLRVDLDDRVQVRVVPIG